MISTWLSKRSKDRHLAVLHWQNRKADSIQEMRKEMREVALQFVLEPLDTITLDTITRDAITRDALMVEALRQTFEDRIFVLKNRRVIHDATVICYPPGPLGEIKVEVAFMAFPGIERVVMDFQIGPVRVDEADAEIGVFYVETH